MNRLVRAAAVAAATLLLADAAAADVKPKYLDSLDEMLLRGTWELVSAQDNGIVGQADGNRVTVAAEKWIAGDLTFEYRLDPTQIPKRIDWTYQRQVWKGIYELSADRLRLCVSPPGQPRPREFVTRPGDQRQLHVRKRVEPAGKKTKPR